MDEEIQLAIKQYNCDQNTKCTDCNRLYIVTNLQCLLHLFIQSTGNYLEPRSDQIKDNFDKYLPMCLETNLRISSRMITGKEK